MGETAKIQAANCPDSFSCRHKKLSSGRIYILETNYKQLLDEVFVISGIIKVEVSVISRS